mmetsp:Transcript_12031/g.29429  ORF Transcript_12031/g.29429 Transcript_12031/m.29429 type:complete len:214 (-) Transcript_12031:14-655(-)
MRPEVSSLILLIAIIPAPWAVSTVARRSVRESSESSPEAVTMTLLRIPPSAALSASRYTRALALPSSSSLYLISYPPPSFGPRSAKPPSRHDWMSAMQCTVCRSGSVSRLAPSRATCPDLSQQYTSMRNPVCVVCASVTAAAPTRSASASSAREGAQIRAIILGGGCPAARLLCSCAASQASVPVLLRADLQPRATSSAPVVAAGNLSTRLFQ